VTSLRTTDAMSTAQSCLGSQENVTSVVTWAGAARGLACALVVLVHVNIYVRAGIATWWPGGDFFGPVFGLAVPIFFMLSGFFTVRFRSPKGPPKLLAYVRRRFRRLILPFLCWNIILLALHTQGAGLSWLMAAYYALTGSWHLYYIFVFFQFLICAFFLERFVDRRWVNWLLAAAAATSILSYTMSDLVLWTRGGDDGTFEIHFQKLFLVWSVFFVLGAWLRWQVGAMELLSRRLRWLFLLGVGSYFVYWWELRLERQWLGYSPRLMLLLGGLAFQVFGALAVLAALYKATRNPGWANSLVARLARIDKDSYCIYLAHPAVLIMFFAAWIKSGIPTAYWFAVPLLWLAIWYACRALLAIVQRIKVGWVAFILFGKIPYRRLATSAVTKGEMNYETSQVC
jgi:fucose 4-O-acetylase-like acetyltransferase